MFHSKSNHLSQVTSLALCLTALFIGASAKFCDDPDNCISKRFIRLGNMRPLSSDPYNRLRRESYRLDRAYPPYYYQDKRFLRFGRSQLPAIDDYSNGGTDYGVFSRKRRSAQNEESRNGGNGLNQFEVSHNQVKRSAPSLGHVSQSDVDKMRSLSEEMPSAIQKREASHPGDSVLGVGARDLVDKRFLRIGKRFMRFGRNQLSGPSSILSGRNNKRFMRFGKRKEQEEEQHEVENSINDVVFTLPELMKVLKAEIEAEGGESNSQGLVGKRFMRFGKRSSENM